METALDACTHGLLVARVEYQCSGRTLCVEVGEALPPNASGRGVLKIRSKSRRFRVRFDSVAAHFLVDESYAVLDDYEVEDSRHWLRHCSRSRLLDFFNLHHGSMFDVEGEGARHFRLCTFDVIVDVIAVGAPVVESLHETG